MHESSAIKYKVLNQGMILGLAEPFASPDPVTDADPMVLKRKLDKSQTFCKEAIEVPLLRELKR